MMSFDRYLAKFFFLAVFCCLVTTAFLVGCGGGNNPGGPAVSSLQSATDSTLVAGSYNILGKVVTENQKAVAGLNVSLYITDSQTGQKKATAVKTMLSLTTGEFTFRGIATGTYIVEVSGSTDYYDSSKLAIVDKDTNIDIGFLVVAAKPTDPTIPTLSLTAKVVDPLSGLPFSVADVSVDSGQATVSNAFGLFSLTGIASGVRTLKISQPGLASYSLVFEVIGATGSNLATGIKFNNVFYAVNAAGNTVDMTLHGKNLEINPSLHQSGVLLGTVKKFTLDALGKPTNALIPYPNFEFELWQIDLQKGLSRKFDSIVSGADGTWRRDQLPPSEDNGFHWFAVPTNTNVTVSNDGGGGTTVVFQNSTWPSGAGEPVLTFGYLVSGGQTTVMDFTIPSAVYTKVESSVAAITNAMFSVNGAAAAVDVTSLINDDLTFTWTGPGSATEVLLEFARTYNSPTTPIVSKRFKFSDTSATALHSYKFKPSEIGMDFGRYTWKTQSIDPLSSSVLAPSESHLITIRPGVADLSPTQGTTINVQPATYTVTFAAPTDPEATYAVLEFYNPAGQLLGSSNDATPTNTAVFKLTWGPNSPAAGNGYTYKVRYFYKDGPPMDSETVTINFQ